MYVPCMYHYVCITTTVPSTHEKSHVPLPAVTELGVLSMEVSGCPLVPRRLTRAVVQSILFFQGPVRF